MNPKSNHGLFEAIQTKLNESDGDYAPKYDQAAGAYHIEHKPTGRIVARGVAVSGGAALAQAGIYNLDPRQDKHLHPTIDHLMDTAHTHQHLQTALHLVKSADFYHASAAKALQTAVDHSKGRVAEVHANFAKDNPDHEYADHAAFMKDVEEGHDNLLKSKIEHQEHRD